MVGSAERRRTFQRPLSMICRDPGSEHWRTAASSHGRPAALAGPAARSVRPHSIPAQGRAAAAIRLPRAFSAVRLAKGEKPFFSAPGLPRRAEGPKLCDL